MGVKRFAAMYRKIMPDIVFILNDLWILNAFVSNFDKRVLKKTVVYFPVDAGGTDIEWLNNFENLGAVNAYTEFGRQEVQALKPYLPVNVIPHGIDTSKFYPLDRDQARKDLNVIRPDDFVVFNGNRNQPRKRIDLTFEAFAKFAINKPSNVKLYAHMGLIDSGWDITKLAQRYGIYDRIIATSSDLGPQTGVPDERLNVIYNSADIGFNTSMGEGWGLMNTEQAAVGVSQLVPDGSACRELFKDCGYLIPIKDHYTYPGQMTIGSVVDSDAAASKLEYLYNHREELRQSGQKCYEKFTRPEYQWSNISLKWQEVFEKVVDEYNLADSTGQLNNPRNP